MGFKLKAHIGLMRSLGERADAVPVALMDGEQFAALLIENGIYVTRLTHDIIELDVAEED